MPVTFDATSGTPTRVTSTATVNLSFTVGATANAIVATISVENGGAPTINSVQWDATGTPQSLTLITSIALGNQRSYLYGLVAPTTGTRTLRVTFAAAPFETFLGATSFIGAHTAGGTTTFAITATGTSTTAAITITSATDNMTLEVTTGPEVLSAPTKTQNYVDNGGSATSAGSSRAAGAATVTHQWTLGSAVQWATAGVSIVAAAGGGGAPADLWIHSPRRMANNQLQPRPFAPGMGR